MSILIIYRHSVNIDIYNVSGITYWIQLFVSHMTDTIVPCFFALSGYLFYQNFSIDKLKEKLSSRVKTIIIPFIIWNIIGYLFMLTIKSVLGDKINMQIPPLLDLRQNLLDIFIHTKYNITWFLLNLILYTYTFPIFYRLIKNKYIGVIIIATILAIGYIMNSGFIMYAATYAMGAIFGIHYKELVQRQYYRNAIQASSVLFIISIIIETYFNFTQGAMLMPLRMLQIIFIWIIADKLAINKSPKWWMTLSFFIYCCHSMILESYEKILLILAGNTPIGSLIDFIFAPVLTIITIYIIACTLRKNKVIWGGLTGYRNK